MTQGCCPWDGATFVQAVGQYPQEPTDKEQYGKSTDPEPRAQVPHPQQAQIEVLSSSLDLHWAPGRVSRGTLANLIPYLLQASTQMSPLSEASDLHKLATQKNNKQTKADP